MLLMQHFNYIMAIKIAASGNFINDFRDIFK